MSTIKSLFVGFLSATATITFALLIPKSMALELLSSVLWSIAAVYFGFVLIDGRKRELLIEIGNMVMTFAFALLGLWVAPYWLAVGYFAHGLWDAIHRPRGIQTKIPLWYVPFCMSYDWMIAGFIILWWR